MAKKVLSVDELRLCDSYILRTDYFMGLSKRMAVFDDANDEIGKKYAFAYDLIKYLELGRELNIVPKKTMEKIMEIIDDM